MINKVYLNLFLVSAVIISFEIIATRISSVIYVNNYAFIIISLAILGLGTGGIAAYYNKGERKKYYPENILPLSLLFTGLSILIFILTITEIGIINPFIYFFLLFIPFFFAGIFYAEIFKAYAASSFSIYAADLAGAAIGSVGSILFINLLGGINSVLILTIITLASVINFVYKQSSKILFLSSYIFLLFLATLVFVNGNNNVLGLIPIGNYPEKDFHHVYTNPNIKSKIIDSRWSIHGRTDLVEHSHQDLVKHIFIDGAAGSPMYRFNGNPQKLSPMLYNILIRYSNTIPFLLLNDYEKNNMLVIGPGGGREVLTGLLTGVDQITGVEINPDFVNIVEDYRDYNGGIYTDFPNVDIIVQEGRHYIKHTNKKYDIINMALPSTEQLQNIDNFAMSENFLLTVEAIEDYLNLLTNEGRLIFTLHNNWELQRLIVTTLFALENIGIDRKDAVNHFIVMENDIAPTIVIKKQGFTEAHIVQSKNIISQLPDNLPKVTYFPFRNTSFINTEINNFLINLKSNNIVLSRYIENYKFDISPCYDNSPYFYKIKRGIPQNFLWLLFVVGIFNLAVIAMPLFKVRRDEHKKIIVSSLLIFSSIGAGFIILEISLFQKLILYLGSPTTSLSVLLSSILIGMGIGSFYSKKILKDTPVKKIIYASSGIILFGTVLFITLPVLLNFLLAYSIFLRAVVVITLLIPLGFLIGIPFPTAIHILNSKNVRDYVPWMYGINGTMTVLGSIAAVIISMVYGFTQAFFIGLGFYFLVIIYLKFGKRNSE